MKADLGQAHIKLAVWNIVGHLTSPCTPLERWEIFNIVPDFITNFLTRFMCPISFLSPHSFPKSKAILKPFFYNGENKANPDFTPWENETDNHKISKSSIWECGVLLPEAPAGELGRFPSEALAGASIT